jgi:hypothetical protein
MIDRFLCVTLLLIASVASGPAQPASSSGKPIESPHRHGSDGLEGWTVSHRQVLEPGYPEAYPDVLIIARHGRVVRKIPGEPFVWQWTFWAGGRQVAYETGPLHWSLTCNLMDIKTGRKLANLDCFHELPADAPAWEKTLETTQ